MSKLIILRGNSGSGKSTVANDLIDQSKRPAVLIEQDHFRFIFKPPGGTINSKTIHKMIKANALAALEDDYDVILEGIFTVKSWKVVFDEIFKKHPKENYVFYFDVSLEETLKRHQMRKSRNLFNEEDMRSWYNDKDFMGYEFEYTIEEKSSKNETIKKIKKVAGI